MFAAWNWTMRSVYTATYTHAHGTIDVNEVLFVFGLSSFSVFFLSLNKSIRMMFYYICISLFFLVFVDEFRFVSAEQWYDASILFVLQTSNARTVHAEEAAILGCGWQVTHLCRFFFCFSLNRFCKQIRPFFRFHLFNTEPSTMRTRCWVKCHANAPWNCMWKNWRR